MRCQMHEIASHAMQQHIIMTRFVQQKHSLTSDPVSFRLLLTWQMRIGVIKTDPWSYCARVIFFLLCKFVCIASKQLKGLIEAEGNEHICATELDKNAAGEK